MSLLSRRFRSKPTAFWCIGAETIDVAVIRDAIGEPLLLACAGVDSRFVARGPRHAPGLFELSVLLEARSLPHVVALGESFCRMVDGGQVGAPEEGRMQVAAVADDGLVCDADVSAAAAIVSDFRALGLRLRALDCGPCARLNLAAFLGEQARPADAPAQLDPLAAVSVAPEVEEDALRMGARLVVPVGLALEYLGWLGDA